MSAHRRFAFVCPNFYPRVCGVGDHTARLADEIARRGFEARIFSRAPAERHPEATGPEVYGASGKFPAVLAFETAKAIAEYRPTDVILQYTPQMWDASRFGAPSFVWLARHLRRAGARITLIAHELFIPWRRRPDLAVAAVFQRLQLSALLKTTDRFFVTTSTRAAGMASLCRLLSAPQPRVVRVGSNALPIAHVDAPSAEGPRIGLFSTAAVGKRYDVILEAFTQIAREFPSAELVLLGDLGPPELPNVVQIMTAIAAHPFKARIRMTGRLSLGEISAQLARLDLYLFPMNTGANTRSGTLPAALGSGVPVVAVRGIETDEALFHHDDNLVFADDLSGPAFAQAALRLLRDPALRRKVAEGGRRLYEEQMSWPRIVDDLLAGE
jgi:glycosyltransferase involved in cell wall biosynthesis